MNIAFPKYFDFLLGYKINIKVTFQFQSEKFLNQTPPPQHFREVTNIVFNHVKIP